MDVLNHTKDFAIAGLIRSLLTGMIGIAVLVVFITVRSLNPFLLLGLIISGVVCLSSVPNVVMRVFEMRKIEKLTTKLQAPGNPVDEEFQSHYRWLLTKIDSCAANGL